VNVIILEVAHESNNGVGMFKHVAAWETEHVEGSY
jgi:hypothetical protein